MLEFLDDNFLQQLVTEQKRENNILELVIVSQDHLINYSVVNEYFGSCDHKVVCARIRKTAKIFGNET